MAVRGFGVGVAAAVVCLCLAGCRVGANAPASEEAANVQTVAVVEAALREAPEIVAATATLSPWQELTIAAETSGLAVVEVDVEENDAVKAGDALVRLDDRVLKAQVAEQEAAVTEARANWQAARQQAARGDRLSAERAMSEESAETRRSAVETSAAKLAAAEAALERLQAELDQTIIRAPAAGIVSTEPIRLGAAPQAGTELLRLIRDGRLEARVKTPERDLGRIRPGQTARVTGPDGVAREARVRDVAAKVDSATRLGTVYVELPAGAPLRPGMFAAVAIETDAVAALEAPEAALVWPQGKPAVFVVEAGNRARLTPVVVAGRRGGAALIESGLEAGARVVTVGAGFLHDGDSVRIAPALEKTASR